MPFTNSSGDADVVNLFKLDLVGNAQQRGFAQGELMASEINELVHVALPKFYVAMLADLDLEEYFPDWLVDLLYAKTPAAFNKALAAVFEKEAAFVPARLSTEMAAIAQGVCAGLAAKASSSPPQGESSLPCDVAEMTDMIKNVNMLPELIRMTCTMFGAWGKASATGNLLQLRALDFGSGPLANFSLLAVHRPPPENADVAGMAAEDKPQQQQQQSVSGSQAGQRLYDNGSGDLWQAFASLSFPAMVGVVTGVSQRGIGLSEKVWEVYNTSSGMQKGQYDGEADVLVMRDVLELAPNRSSAEDHMRSDDNRTWAVFLGVGDYETQQMDIVGYRAADFHAYTPDTMPAVTLQPYFEDLVYVDKHPQPSHDPSSLPDLLAKYWGNLSMEATSAINAGHETGDLHIAVYDFAGVTGKQLNKGPDGELSSSASSASSSSAGTPKLWVSVGRVNENGDYGSDNKEWKACFRPYLEFTMADLWAGTW